MSLGSGLLMGRAAVQSAWHQLLCGLCADSRHLVLVDPHFADLPLSDSAVLAALAGWLALPGRSLRLLGLDFAATERAHPRFARWRRDWAHKVQPLVPHDAAHVVRQAAWPRVVACEQGAVEWLDGVHWRARSHATGQQWLSHTDAMAQHCEPSWPVQPLGL